MKKYLKIIQEICNKKEIKITTLCNDFIIKLEKNNKIKFLYGYKFPLNDHALGEVLDDKQAFYEVLKSLNINTVITTPIFTNYNQDDLLNYFNKYNQEVIIKSTNGTCGKEVFKITNQAELIKQVDKLLNIHSPICISPYYHIKNEYRVIVLNNQIKLIYGKKRPIIKGNGINTIYQLLLEFNNNYYSKNNNLKQIKYDLNYIPKVDEIIEIDFKFNLSRGANIFNASNTIKNKLEKIALNVVCSLNIKFASIDIIETNDNKLLVLEANSGIMMDNYIDLSKDGYLTATNIYQDAIELLFRD